MGRRTNPRLAQSKPPPGKGFRGVDRERQSVGLHCLGAAAHQEISLTLTQCFFDTIQLFRFSSDTKRRELWRARTRIGDTVRRKHENMARYAARMVERIGKSHLAPRRLLVH